MKIEVLGTGCKKCAQLATQVESIAQSLGVDFELEKVTDISRILEYEVMSTPAIVIDGEVKTSGGVPSPSQIEALLR